MIRTVLVVFGAIELIMVISLIFMCIIILSIKRTSNSIETQVRSTKSAMNDRMCEHKDVLYRIDRRCDAINQRTKAKQNKRPVESNSVARRHNYQRKSFNGPDQ